MNRGIRTTVLLAGGAVAGLALALGVESGAGRTPVSAGTLAPPPVETAVRTVPGNPEQLQLSFAPVAGAPLRRWSMFIRRGSTAVARR